jgi:voltage-gated potassium channel
VESTDPRLRPFLERMLFGQPLTARRAARLIAGTSLVLTLAGGVVARFVDHRDFNTLGDGLWWALQTVTTVGYGDIVPTNFVGRIIGAALMLNGIALITVITATVTATLVERARRERDGSQGQVLAKLDRIESRLDELSRCGSDPGPPRA